VSLAHLLTTLATREEALSLARSAVNERVAACVQVIGPITSVYRWEGRTNEDQEFLCLLKVPSGRLERLIQFVKARHPYDTPEITAVEASFVDERYLAWANSETIGREA
jgi:periplasmic divalent cation tolerance protein